MKKYLFLILAISGLHADTYSILGEPLMSPYAMSENWITATNGLMALDNAYLNPDNGSEGQNVLRRAGEWIFVWVPACELEMVTNHEVFGHGYRIRDLGSNLARVSSYRIYPPFPYYTGGGETLFTFTNSLQPEQFIDIALGGMDASNVLASRIKINLMQSRKIDGRLTPLYFLSAQDTTLYIAATKDFPGTEDGNDVSEYVTWFNIIHPNATISQSQLKRNTWINVLDPMTFYSLYGVFTFVAFGTPAPVWMIPCGGNVYLLPNFRYQLAPYGPEKYVEAYLSVDDDPIYCYVKTGKNAGTRHWGAGLEYPKVLKWEYFSLGGRIDLWKQSSWTTEESFTQVVSNTLAGTQTPFKRHVQYGISAYLIASPSIPNTPCGFLLNAGFKTKGYQPGLSLDACPIIRFGLTARF